VGKLLVVIVLVAGLSGLSQAEEAASIGSMAPRISLPGALGPEPGAATLSYSFRAASHGGRDLNSHQVEATAGVTDRLDLGVDYHTIDATGRSAANTLDVNTIGVQLRYRRELLDAPGAVFVGYRRSDAFALLSGATQDPPNAECVTVGAVRTSQWHGNRAIHAVGTVSRAEVGSESAWTIMGGAGLDYPLKHGLTARGDLALFGNAGDRSGFEAAISGGVHYQRGGLSADLMGTFLPSGTPIAGNPLADASVFGLYPIFGNSGVAHDLANDALGFVTVRVGYTRQF